MAGNPMIAAWTAIEVRTAHGRTMEEQGRMRARYPQIDMFGRVPAGQLAALIAAERDAWTRYTTTRTVGAMTAWLHAWRRLDLASASQEEAHNG